MASKNGDGGTGYCRPPRQSQFQPGQSGNPHGRPPKIPTFADDVLEELQLVHPAKDGAAQISNQKRIVTALVAKAAKGDAPAIAQLLRLIPKNDHTGPESEPPNLTPTQHSIVRDFTRAKSPPKK